MVVGKGDCVVVGFGVNVVPPPPQELPIHKVPSYKIISFQKYNVSLKEVTGQSASEQHST